MDWHHPHPHQNANKHNDNNIPLHLLRPSEHPAESDYQRHGLFVDPSGMPSLPPMPSGGGLDLTLNNDNPISSYDFRSPQATDVAQLAGATAVVTPSPVTNSSMTIGTPACHISPDRSQDVTTTCSTKNTTKNTKRKEDLNPLQMAAAFFGIHLGGDEKEEDAAHNDLVDTSIPDPPILTSTIQPKTSSSSRRVEGDADNQSSHLVQPSVRRAIPIPTSSTKHPPSGTNRRESFCEANHRRHSAPLEMTPSNGEQSSSGLMDSGLSFGPHNTQHHSLLEPGSVLQDFYDHRDGHLWRAKYCVLEDGVLYFYRNANDGESVEAAAERKETHFEDSGTTSFSTSSNRFIPPQAQLPSSKSIANLSRRRSSAKDLSQSPMIRPILHHLDSSESCGSGTMWEKRVFLDCIEEVRTAENRFGKNSFELTALSDDDDHHVDKLVLQAPNLDEMNEWIFQFHRSLASLMRNIIDVFGSTSTSGAFLDIQRPPSMLTPLSSSHHTSLRLAGSIPQSPSEKQLRRLVAMSPRFHHQIFDSATTPIQPTLSHGHGRTSLRRKADLKRTSSEGASVSSTTDAADDDSPQHHFAFQEPSPNSNIRGTPETISPPLQFLIPPQSSITVNALPAVPNLLDNLLIVDNRHTIAASPIPFQSPDPERSGPAAEVPEMERPKPATGKYIPPHLRHRQESHPSQIQGKTPAPTKYVPPHMRYRPAEVAPAFSPATVTSLSLAERAQLAPSTPNRGESFVEADVPQPNELNIVGLHASDFVRGGCAAPHLVQGSVLDQAFVPKSAGRVSKSSSEAFGSFGGVSSDEDTKSSMQVSDLPDSSLRWEIGAISECGVRDYNEDAFVVSNDLFNALKAVPSQTSSPMVWDREIASHSPGLFAIFDGHCGNQAARFGVERFGHYLKDRLQREPIADAPSGSESAEAILHDVMMKMDSDFCLLSREGGREWESGATALVAILMNEHLVVANLGDCRGILCRSVENDPAYTKVHGWEKLEEVDDDLTRVDPPSTSSSDNPCYFREVTNTHTPAAVEERIRIENANGWITTDQDIPIAQWRRMDFDDEDVLPIFNRCIRYSVGNVPSSVNASERSTKECSTAPHRILHISRVCGELAVSRALGDRDFKAAYNSVSDDEEYSMDPLNADSDPWWDSQLDFIYPNDHNHRFQGDLVSGVPDIQRFKVGESGVSDEFLLLACDGLWDVLDTDDAVRVVRDLLFRQNWTAKRAAARLAELAIHLGSSDNVTVIIVRLHAATSKK